jgi:hypothetical protein
VTEHGPVQSKDGLSFPASHAPATPSKRAQSSDSRTPLGQDTATPSAHEALASGVQPAEAASLSAKHDTHVTRCGSEGKPPHVRVPKLLQSIPMSPPSALHE